MAGDVEVLVRLGLASDDATGLPRLPTAEVAAANARRRALLARVARGGALSHKGAKPHLGALSPGCVRCGERDWTCMFLNQHCNGSCFFCPGPMDTRGAAPFAERFVFHTPDAYARYVERMGFRGVSFSGGDPMLTLDALRAHVRAVRERLGDDVYVWIYTNGSATRGGRLERLLAGGGVDEVRFNIAAWDYDLEAVAEAVRVAPRVTVEIPAIPEDLERLKALLPELERVGVAHLNLHQLMVLGTNGEALASHPYRFTADSVPAVIDSELCALELMAFALDAGITLPINYCGATYKERLHGTGLDFRAATAVAGPSEVVTESGMLRRLWLPRRSEAGEDVTARLSAAGADPARWREDADRGGLVVHPSLLGELGELPRDAWVTYHRCLLLGAADGVEDAESVPHEAHPVDLGDGQRLHVVVVPVSAELPVDRGALRALSAGETPPALLAWEQLPYGLPDYA
ncbi:MAG: radical SAM protein [Deltaproteobacteria bacterium]|nr:MAG: radical SAM protein [Deltaproteobacteria bacterium]